MDQAPLMHAEDNHARASENEPATTTPPPVSANFHDPNVPPPGLSHPQGHLDSIAGGAFQAVIQDHPLWEQEVELERGGLKAAAERICAQQGMPEQYPYREPIRLEDTK